MKLFKTTITPSSNFGTSLKGDTLFGQICWALYYADKERFERLLKSYTEQPFLVVSDAFAKGYLPKPHLPSHLLGEDSDEKKVNRKKVWLTLSDLQNGTYVNAKKDDEVESSDKELTVIRNAINYKTFTTGAEGFDPYGERELKLSQKNIYFLLDDVFQIDELKRALEFVSMMGYGKDASIGKGRFTFSVFEEVLLASKSKSFMTLSPFSPMGLASDELFYEPFTRFGKHGGDLANKNPFKKPLLLADVGAVVSFEKKKHLPYVGRAIEGHSVHKGTVHQGYAIVVPIKDLHE